VTSAVGVDEQDPQLCRRVMVGIDDAEDGARAPAIDLRDPGCLSLRVMVGGVGPTQSSSFGEDRASARVYLRRSVRRTSAMGSAVCRGYLYEQI
jgi:hypothetical protein